MKLLSKKLIALLVFLVIANFMYAQDTPIETSNLPETKEEFIKSENNVINVINWLENGSMDDKLRTVRKAYFLAWITNSPTVTISVNDKILAFMNEKNPELLVLFMGGWTKYSLENNYSADGIKCNVAGIKSVIKFYKANLNKGIKKDKAIEKLIELNDKNELESFVKEIIDKK